MDEHVLVFCLDHVVPLGPETCDMAVNVDRLLVLDPLQHRVDHDEGARSANASAVNREKQERKMLFMNFFLSL